MRLGKVIKAETPVLTTSDGRDSCLSLLRDEFNSRYPIGSRRLDFFSSYQESGQLFSDYMVKARMLWLEADIEHLGGEGTLLYKYLSGCTDQELRCELLKICRFQSPSVDQFEEYVLNWETARREDKRIAKSYPAKANQVKSGQGKGGKGKKNQGSQQSSSPGKSLQQRLA